MKLLTTPEGPWAWPATRYELFDGSIKGRENFTTLTQAEVQRLRCLGGVTATPSGGGMSFAFSQDEEPLELELESFDLAGTGGRVWDSAVALALFQRSTVSGIQPCSSVLELGAGVGLPGLDLCRRGAAESVTLTDNVPAVLQLQQRNARALANGSCVVDVAELQWGGDEGKALGRRFDLVLGADIAYEAASQEPLVSLLATLLSMADGAGFRSRAPIVRLVSPLLRTHATELVARLAASPGMRVRERRLTLLCHNAMVPEPKAKSQGRSASIFRLAEISPA